MAFKILHTSDWHLGCEFSAYSDSEALALSRARAGAVEKILHQARRERVDAVLCAGDLFDVPNPRREWWSTLQHIFATAGLDAPVFLLPGNHDPLMPGSVYLPEHDFRQGLPANVQIIDRDDFTWPFADTAVLHATPCRSKSGAGDPLANLPARADGDERIRIAMVHGQVPSSPGFHHNFPIHPETAAAKGYDYLALGDYHSPQRIETDGGMPACYPGTPEPSRHGEEGAGKALVVLFTRPRQAHVKEFTCGHWLWRQEHCDRLADLEQLLRDPDLHRTNLRLSLRLCLSVTDYSRAEQILTQLSGSAAASGRAGILEIADKRLTLDTNADDSLPEGAPEVFERVLERLKQDPEREVAERALYLFHSLVEELL